MPQGGASGCSIFKTILESPAEYAQIGEFLSQIPEDAPVAATTFYTTPLSQREVLYDVRYCSQEHLLSTQYVVLDTGGFQELYVL